MGVFDAGRVRDLGLPLFEDPSLPSGAGETGGGGGHLALFRGVARILLKGVLNLVSLIRPFLQLVGCSVLSSLATLSAFSLET